MDEASKTKKIWSDFHKSILKGKGIDIGCGPDPILPDVFRFDLEQGDANEITRYVKNKYDFVFSSHCLEHMNDPKKAILEWWHIVTPGGYLFIIVPDEDLYEQGVFPSRFNGDHKSTFTIKKNKSWSPVSVNLLDLVQSLPNSQLVNIELQDNHYDRRLLKHGPIDKNIFTYILNKIHPKIKNIFPKTAKAINNRYNTVDQTRNPVTLAQIQCIIKKLA